MDKKRQKEILRVVGNIIEPVIDELGYELLDVEYVVERGRWTLRIYIDKEGGVSVNDCAIVSKEVSPILDVEDPIDNSYVLEVSSPGLKRPLTKEKHFVWAIGKKIKVKTEMPIQGRRNFTGLLQDFKDGTLFLDVEGEMFSLSYDNIEKANLVYEIDKSIL
ncbi:MAG: ribosome maturation factor RimP [Deltaproteobacteria bacterium]|nr:MAG: ribosome maturation factor RimP [Deltaproteobacteria bacterium]